MPAELSEQFIREIEPKRFKWIDPETNGDEFVFGFIAQDIKQALSTITPNANDYSIFLEAEGPDDRGHEKYWGIDNAQLIAPMMVVVKSHIAKIEALETALAAALVRLDALDGGS